MNLTNVIALDTSCHGLLLTEPLLDDDCVGVVAFDDMLVVVEAGAVDTDDHDLIRVGF